MKPQTENYKDLSNLLKNLGTDNKFSEDKEQFEKNCDELIKFIETSSSKDTFIDLYVVRQKNNIEYGNYNEYGKVTSHKIEMTSGEDLKIIFDKIETNFKDRFILKFKYSEQNGLSLYIIIPENIIIEFDSDNKYDKEWFFNKSNKNIDASKFIK